MIAIEQAERFQPKSLETLHRRHKENQLTVEMS